MLCRGDSMQGLLKSHRHQWAVVRAAGTSTSRELIWPLVHIAGGSLYYPSTPYCHQGMPFSLPSLVLGESQCWLKEQLFYALSLTAYGQSQALLLPSHVTIQYFLEMLLHVPKFQLSRTPWTHKAPVNHLT